MTVTLEHAPRRPTLAIASLCILLWHAGAQAQAQTNQNWQNEARTERREDRTEIERYAAIHTGAPIGDDDRKPAMTFH